MIAEKPVSPPQESGSRPSRHRDSLLLGGLLALSLLLRLFCWYMEPTLSRDGVHYVELIQVWADGGSFQAVLHHWPECWFPPLPLWLVLLPVKCGIPVEAAGIGINLALGSLIPLLVYRIAKIVTECRSIALGAALLAAVHPMLIELAIEIQRDTTYLFLIGCAICALLDAAKRQNCRHWGIGGAWLGLAILTRFESLEFLPVAVCYLAGSVCLRVQNCRTALKQFGVFCTGILLACFLTSWLMGVPFSYYRIYSDRITKMVAKIIPTEKTGQSR